MKRQIFMLLLLLAIPAFVCADSVTLVGTLSNIPANPGESIEYNLSITPSLHTIISAVDGLPSTFVEDLLSGKMLFKQDGTLFSTLNITNDAFLFGVNEQPFIAFQFGQFTPIVGVPLFAPPPTFLRGYELALDQHGGQWIFVDNRVATPEPGVAVLMLVASLLALPSLRRIKVF